jgi:hypothetical protein
VDPQQQVIDDYHRLESRLGYTPLLGGTKHFGWYPPGSRRLPMRMALTLMEAYRYRAVWRYNIVTARKPTGAHPT